MVKLRIAIISDLHCHHSRSGRDDTYLTTDSLRTNVNNHPVESLLRVINAESLSVDLMLCPGDFTNHADVQGFISGWDFIHEINTALGGGEIIATLGNHDVDSHETYTNYSLETAKGIRKGFPVRRDEDRDTLWSKGCVFLEGDHYRTLVINSSHYHHNKETAESGKVGDDLIDYVEQYLRDKADGKISIALAHHHPIDHSRLDLGEQDKIVNGDKLLEALAPFQFDLFVHGHKHDPLLRYHPFHGNNGRIPILSAGSFSAKSNVGFTGRRNTFHIVELFKEPGSPCLGKITTWTFIPRSGWRINSDDHGFDSYTGFGYGGNLVDLLNRIAHAVGTSTIKRWSEIVNFIPEIEYLIPSESEELYTQLRSKNLILDKKLSQKPEIISNTSNAP